MVGISGGASKKEGAVVAGIENTGFISDTG
jgi:hypothetical protein